MTITLTANDILILKGTVIVLNKIIAASAVVAIAAALRADLSNLNANEAWLFW